MTRMLRKYIALLVLTAMTSSIAVAGGPALNAPAPHATIKLLDGRTLDTEALRGKVVVIAFWATWCAYCKQELTDLAAYYREHAPQGMEVIAVSADEAEDLAKVRERAAGYPFPVALMADAQLKDYGRIWRLPLTFVIDRRGMLRRDGWSDSPAVTRQQLDDTITPLLREKD